MLWFPLAEHQDGAVADLASRLSAELQPEASGGDIRFDGTSYVDASIAEMVELGGEGFTLALQMKGGSVGTLLGSGRLGMPGSFRLMTDGAAITFELCDGLGCQRVGGDVASTSGDNLVAVHLSQEGTDQGSSAAPARVSLRVLDAEGQRFGVDESLDVDAPFNWTTPGPLVLGAELTLVPAESAGDGADAGAPSEAVSGQLIGELRHVMLFDGALSDDFLAELAGPEADAYCEACMNDETPPALVCPAPFEAPAGELINAPEAIATDDCDPTPIVDVSLSQALPAKDADAVTLTYTATDASGNQSTCEVVARVAKPPAKVTTAYVTNESCSLSVSPTTVPNGGVVTAQATHGFTCNNGPCFFRYRVYRTKAGSLQESPVTGLGTTVTGPFTQSASPSLNLVNELPLNAANADVVFRYEVRETSWNGPVIKVWDCRQSVVVAPVEHMYCQKTNAYWLDRITSGDVQLHVLSNVWNSSSGWYNGTSGADLIIGNQYDNKIRGQGGNDCLVGDAGADKLRGNDGADWIDGGPGNDDIEGDGGNDTLWGGSEVDHISGGDQGDYIYGGSSGDFIHGNYGNDYVWGESGPDYIWGDPGNDTLDGGPGDDKIEGGNDGDSLFGKTGCDKLTGNGGDDWIFGDEHSDRIFGGDNRDTIFGGDGRNMIQGGGNDDTISSVGFDEWICGDSGADTISAGPGSQCRGGSGNDTLNCDDNSGAPCNASWDVLGLWPCQ